MRILVLTGIFGGLAAGATFTYNDFSNTSGLTLNGSAAQSGNVLRLVPSQPGQGGTAYYSTPISFDTNTYFSTAFEFLVTSDPNSALGVTDGFTFQVQSQSVNALGAAGEGNGYEGVSPSLAVVFRGRGPSYIGVVTGGVDPATNIPPDATTFNTDGVFYDQNEFAWIDYDPSSHSMLIYLNTTSSKPTTPIASTAIDVLGTVGSQAWVGFGAGNGGAFASQDILNWDFTAAPEPATFAILGVGLAALGMIRKVR